jgi:glycosyltransferase involved in cell wall biosynthesis
MSDQFCPCALIPVYNHGGTARAVVRELVHHGLPVILVDDGSRADTKDQLAAIVAEFSGTSLFTLAQNQGKGGAVAHGLRQAHRLGYSHALQVDADGQHDLGEILTFIETARADPEAMVCGRPVYDDSVPTGRKIGRKITNFWVAIETLSRDIPDAMCGFRVYPVAACWRLLGQREISKRMEFDIEILIRLHWQGVRMRFLPVKVIYPEGGLSHFRVVKDNVAISRIHTLLFLGMLWRSPWILGRRIGRRARGGQRDRAA